MNYLIITYSVYIVITLLLTIWVGNTLFKHGKVFLMDIFQRDETLVNGINNLLRIGFYLINFGYVLRNLTTRRNIDTLAECFEMLSTKIGLIVVILGFIHFLNIIVLFMLRSRVKKTATTVLH